MPFFKNEEISLFYELIENSAGVSPTPITLLNGHSRSSRDFHLLRKKIVDSGFSVLLLDNRASGQSSKGVSGWGIKDMASDVVALWQHLGIQSSHLLGISLGGVIAQLVYEMCPEKIDSLILISTLSSPEFLPKESLQSWPEDIDTIFAKLLNYVSPQFVQKNKLLVQAMAKNIRDLIIRGDFLSNAKLQQQALAQMPLLDWSKQPRDCRTLIVHGDLDAVIVKAASEKLAKNFNNPSLHFFADAGHLLLAEKSSELGKVLIEFWQNSDK